jgi:hypothetical protein
MDLSVLKSSKLAESTPLSDSVLKTLDEKETSKLVSCGISLDRELCHRMYF